MLPQIGNDCTGLTEPSRIPNTRSKKLSPAQRTEIARKLGSHGAGSSVSRSESESPHWVGKLRQGYLKPNERSNHKKDQSCRLPHAIPRLVGTSIP
jgi:hypothetical protein